MDINKYFKINKENLLNLLDTFKMANADDGTISFSLTMDKDILDDKIDEDIYILDGFSCKNEIYVLAYILDTDKIIVLKGYEFNKKNRCKIINNIDSDLFAAIIDDIYNEDVLDLNIITVDNELLNTDEYIKYKLKNRM